MEKKYNPPIKEIKLMIGKSFDGHFQDDRLIFVIEGVIHLLLGEAITQKNIEKKMFIISKGTTYNILAKEESVLLLFNFQGYRRLFEHFFSSIDSPPKKYRFLTLSIHEKIGCFMDTIRVCLLQEVLKMDYYYVKLYELILLLTNYYEEKELQEFFLPFRYKNHTFSNFVMENHEKVKSVKELVALSNYSLSAFKKHFYETFGQAPYQWMKTQKAIRLYAGLTLTDKSLTEICDTFGFSSLSQLAAFCKSNFGKSPSMIRKMK
ncbi:AraC family transcriptional regulator [Parabacteroides sp. PF5-9]|uniref:helix-turn-helix domain-containing protein n=1 Tax=Parabacteroides sp. PF5-9 TaxID=1742404 RepID=UPI0024766E62|nr:AraC family transcriptional regulator [Parabacteroides sp. PF5-9]MDH6358326.1 AraC-like DNA-binding protein [Parabacteroides sp. PF5-9]